MNGQREHILIVEDSPTQAEHLRYVLERNGYTAGMARNGRQALESVAAKIPDLIISDIVMPEMDGFTLCSMIKMQERTRSVPVMLLTSLADSQDVLKALQCGADNFLTKPFDEPYLMSRITHLLRHDHRIDSEDTAVELEFEGERYVIKSDRKQIVHLLLSVYDAAVRRTRELDERTAQLSSTVDRLEQSNRDLESFAYVASHDLQEPLRMVAGYMQLLERRFSDQLDEKAKAYITYAADGATRMQALIEGLLEFSRISRGAEFAQVDTNATLATALANLEQKLEETGGIVTSDHLPVVRGSETHLLRLFQNLIDNALKYRKPEVKPQIHIAAHGEGNWWVFSVKDNGIGIAAQYRDRIFQIFQRLHTRDEYSGSGIGLASCKRIIENHGGKIWVESQPEEGSTFLFTLPDAAT